MNAMILAAGFGTRLAPLTNSLPKALVPLGGSTLLGLILRKLEASGFSTIAVNGHAHAQQIEKFLTEFSKLSKAKIYFSDEPQILDTGGGIKNMLRFMENNQPILVHNVDILTSLDLAEIMQHHTQNEALATLVINRRKTDRPLLFDENYLFGGRAYGNRPPTRGNFGFCGIQVINPSLFRTVREEIFYSIDVYEKAARGGGKIKGFDIGKSYWRDIGTIEDLHAAEQDIRAGIFSL